MQLLWLEVIIIRIFSQLTKQAVHIDLDRRYVKGSEAETLFQLYFGVVLS